MVVSPIFNAAGRIIGASAIARDITQRKEAEDALRESQSMLEHSQAFSLVMAAHIGLDGCWIKVPPEALRVAWIFRSGNAGAKISGRDAP